MKIIVCMKQVPDTTEVKIDPKTGRLIREGVPSIINPEDKNALEEALRIKEKNNAYITVLTMGPPQAEDALREALAMGADKAILLGDIKFAGSDTWATANALAACVKKIGEYDLILCGRQAIDGDTAQVGPQLAEALKIPQITYAQKIDMIENGVRVERELEDGHEVIETKLPCLITVTQNINCPRYPSLKGIDESFNKEMIGMNAADVEVDEALVGIKNSPTKVKKTFTPSGKGQSSMLKGSNAEMAKELICMLREKKLIQVFD
ncbi:MAG: electron transfer flavoprotein subunit beta/FixA family protein [Nanoarchaeota archaeon]